MKRFMGKGKCSDGLNVPQEKSFDDVESDSQSEEPSEERDENLSEEPSEEPSIESFCQSSCSNENNDDSEHQSKYVQADSSVEERSVDINAGQEGVSRVQSQIVYKQEHSIESGSDAWAATTTPRNKNLRDEGASQQQEQGSSGKRRRSRWEPLLGDDLKVIEADGTSKRRKTRWAADDSQLKMQGSIQLPDLVKNLADLDPEIRDLNLRLLEINRKLQGAKVSDDRPEEERSPSPPPVYNNLGIGINSREVTLRQKLSQEKQDIISKLFQRDLFFKSPPDQKLPQKFYKKIYAPVKEYPSYNFAGLIIGPRGNTQKRMERETGAKIYIRGKSFKDVKRQIRGDRKSDPSENEDLHVIVEADCQKSLDAAAEMVEKLLVPVEDGMNEHKRAQLMELAKLNGTCKRCGEPGHIQSGCPARNSTLKVDVSCDVCGGDHPTASCPLTASDSGNILDGVISEINHGSAVFGVSHSPGGSIHGTGNPALLGGLCYYGSFSNTGSTSIEAPESNSKKEIDDSKLYVCHLPLELDDKQLKQLFSPFGSIKHVKVVKDGKTGVSKGYGFVNFRDPANAARAIKHMNDYEIDGKVLAVRVAGRPTAAPLSLESVGTTAMKLLPTYMGPPSVPQDNPVQSAWPGPPGSMLPEPSATFSKSDALALPPVSSEETDCFSKRLPSYYGSDCSISSSPSTFPSSRDYSTDYSRQTFHDYSTDYSRQTFCDYSAHYTRQSDSTNNRQFPLSYGSSYKIPRSTTSTFSQLPSSLSSSSSYLGRDDHFFRYSPSSRSSYNIPVSSSSALLNFPGNLRSSPRELAQTDSFSRDFPSSRSSY